MAICSGQFTPRLIHSDNTFQHSLQECTTGNFWNGPSSWLNKVKGPNKAVLNRREKNADCGANVLSCGHLASASGQIEASFYVEHCCKINGEVILES